MSATIKRGASSPKMNMTPMIDVTFQLIIFFMLVNNIITEETVEMVVPELEDPKTRELTKVEKVVVNIEPGIIADRSRDNPLETAGGNPLPPIEATRVKVGMTWFSMEQLPAVASELKKQASEAPRDEDGVSSALEVLLRADCGLAYRDVQGVMEAISQAGISKVNLVAYLPEDKKKGTESEDN